MPDEPETTPPKKSPVTSIALSVLAGLFGLLLSVWALIAFGLCLGALVGVRKLRHKPLLGRLEATVSVSVLIAAIVGSVIYSPVCAYMDYKIQQAHKDFGAEMTAESVEYEPVSFSVNYVGYELTAPGIHAKTRNTRFWLDLPLATVFDVEPIRVRPEQLEVELILADITSNDSEVSKLPYIDTSDAVVKIVEQDFTIEMSIDRLYWMKHRWVIGLDEFEIEYRNLVHKFNVKGTPYLKFNDSKLELNVDSMTISNKDGLHAMLQGGFGGGHELHITLDYLNLNALWAKYRIIDEHHGKARGKMAISGDWNNARIIWDIELSDWSYYHKTAMGFNEDNSFRFSSAGFSGSAALGANSNNNLQLILRTVGKLTTGKKFNAQGSGTLEVNRVNNELRASVQMKVESGEINTPISWNGATGGLKSITPNVILLVEELPHMPIDYNITVNNLAVNCDPLWGKLSGTLQGRLSRADGRKKSIIRAEGKLTLTDGQFAFLGTHGTVEGDIIFRKDNPIKYATLIGKLSGSTGSTPVNARIRSQLSMPGLIFTGLRQSLPSLGKEIYSSGDFLEPVRIAKTTLLFGGTAAFKRDVFAKTNKRRSVIIGRE